MKKSGLAALLSPKSVGDFLPFLQKNQFLHLSPLSTRLGPFQTLPGLASIESLLSLWPDRVQAHLPKIADEASSLEVSTRDAKKLFENGMSLRFDEAQGLSPELRSWLTEIRNDLGLSSLTHSRCLLYATPEGKGTAPHFDQNVNFVLQLQGTKQWWLAPNTFVENPLSRHTMGLPADAELSTYATEPPPFDMPKDIAPITLEPGALLFVPRGVWHWTEAKDDAFSLNFTYSAPTWLDLLSAALRSRLALSVEWRETAIGVSGSLDQRETAEQRFEQLLSELTYDLPHWRAADILQATEAD